MLESVPETNHEANISCLTMGVFNGLSNSHLAGIHQNLQPLSSEYSNQMVKMTELFYLDLLCKRNFQLQKAIKHL